LFKLRQLIDNLYIEMGWEMLQARNKHHKK
jgi:hypothetical protein